MWTVACLSSESACRLVGQGRCTHRLGGAAVMVLLSCMEEVLAVSMQLPPLPWGGLHVFTLLLRSGHFVSNEQLVSEPNPKAVVTRGNS